MALSEKEKRRYDRHIKLPEFGIEGQERLKKSKVLVIGSGGLGAPLLQYLTAVGIGTIGVMDYDLVEESNLQRQVLFGNSDIGKSKSSTAISRLKDQNPNVEFVEFNEKLTSKNAIRIIKQFDIIADGTDNFPTRYLINDACVFCNKAFVYASIYQFEGQLSVFNFQDGPNYRDLYPSPPPAGMVPSCAEGGVLGVLPGIIGSIQATEIIKVLTGIGETLSGKLLLIDSLKFSFRKINIRKDPENPINGKNRSITQIIDYEEFCAPKSSNIKSIDVHDLKNWETTNKKFYLIDVREEYEHESSNLGGQLIPQNELDDHLDKIPKIGEVVIYCKSGQRSAAAINYLQDKYAYKNLFNLEGGILAWKSEIDPDLIIG